MNIAYNIILGVASLLALAVTLIILVTGKGDAMSGGGGVRTTFKGKASIEDQISRMTMFLALGFMVLMVVLDFLGSRQF